MRLLFAVLFLLNIANHATKPKPEPEPCHRDPWPCIPWENGQMGQMWRRNGNVFQLLLRFALPITRFLWHINNRWGTWWRWFWTIWRYRNCICFRMCVLLLYTLLASNLLRFCSALHKCQKKSEREILMLINRIHPFEPWGGSSLASKVWRI